MNFMHLNRKAMLWGMGNRQNLLNVGMFFLLLMFYAGYTKAEELTLKSVGYAAMSGDDLQLQFSLNGPAFKPRIFQTENPARLVLDFNGVHNGIEKKMTSVNVGAASSIHASEVAGRTRVVVNLLSMASYETHVEGSNVFVTLKDNNAAVKAVASGTRKRTRGKAKHAIRNIDFRRGPKGEGRVIISLSDPKAAVDVREQGGKVVVYFVNTTLPAALAKKLDVTDFDTPVNSIETVPEGNRVRMTIKPNTANYEYISFQKEGRLALEFRPLTKAEKEAIEKKKIAFSGERLSLNFQDIPIRSVLQILADFTDLNIIAADSVKGNVTLRLNDVPWDQALDLILKSKGLSKRQIGSVVMVAPTKEINEQEKQELEALAFREEKEPLRTEILQVNYADVSEIKQVLMGMQDSGKANDVLNINPGVATYFGQNTEASSGGLNSGSILSARGSVNIDPRTNVLIIKDTTHNLEAIRKLVKVLDKPVRQVLIEARVVKASDNFARKFGVKTSGGKLMIDGNTERLVGGTIGDQFGLDNSDLAQVGRLVDLGVAGATGGVGVAILRAGDYLLELELEAMQESKQGEVVSAPRVITSDKKKATISQGFEIPYQTSSANSGTNTQFKKAELKLEVTPLITPDDHVVLDLVVTKDEPNGDANNEPALRTSKVETTVQVDNGETVVLGGVFETTKDNDVDSVPFFGDLPGIGFLFKRTAKTEGKSELLIFVTPKILKDTIAAR